MSGSDTRPSHLGGSRTLRAILAAVALSTAGVLPVFLVGAESSFEHRSLGLSGLAVSFLISAFFFVASGASWLSGRWGARLRPELAMRVGASATCVGSGLVLVAGNVCILAVALVLCGAGYGAAQPAVSTFLLRHVRKARQGFAFGLRQTSVPMATLMSGVTVAFIARTGWRNAYAVPVLLVAVTFLLLMGNKQEGAVGGIRRIQPASAAPPMGWSMTVLAVAFGFGASTIYVFASFNVPYSMTQGFDTSSAGALAAAGGFLALLVRLGAGICNDRYPSAQQLRVVGLMLLVSGSGYAVVAFGGRSTLIPATLVVFAAGSGWNGLALHALVRAFPEQATRATGAGLTGAYLGGAIGPPVFGLLVDSLGYAVAWVCVLAFAVAAGVMMLLGWVMTRSAERPRWQVI